MSDWDDLAGQQIFTEFLASSQKAVQSPESIAARNAAFLNEARVMPHPPSSPSRMPAPVERTSPVATKGRASTSGGKLKRPRFSNIDLAARPNPNLARRGDPYEIQSSPEKVTKKVPTETSLKAQKQQKRHTVHGVPEQSDPSTTALNPPEPDVIVDATLPSTPEASGPSLRSRKRKSANQQLESSKRSKSPSAVEASGEEAATPADQAIPRKARGRPGRKKKALVPEDSDNINAEKLQNDTSGMLINDLAFYQPVEQEQEPPQSAQKLPEQHAERPQPQKPKHRKIRQLKPSKVTDCLELSSDDHEGSKIFTSLPDQTEHHQRPVKTGEKRLKAPEKAVDQDEPKTQEKDIQVPEPAPVRERGRPPKASTKPTEDNGPAQKARVPEQPEPIVQKRTREKNAAIAATARSEPALTNSVDHSLQQRKHGGNSRRHGTRASRKRSEIDNNEQNDPEDPASDVREVPVSDAESEIGQDEQQDEHQGQEDQDDEEELQDREEDDDDGEERQDQEEVQLSDIEKVFQFLDSRERDGDCRTDDARAVRQACDTARQVVLDPDSTLSEISTTTKFVQLQLKNYGTGAEVDAKQRKALKIDAYTRVFRQAIGHLEALHDWLGKEHTDIQSSLDAMRIISPFVNRIVSLKDCIADWKVNIGNRYKGDRIIKDVDSGLITPLRKVEEAYRVSLRTLKETARQKLAHDEALERAREREEVAQRKHEFDEMRKKKHIFWVDLHVHRLQVEHDSWRRQALAMKQEYFDEQMDRYTNDTDANGFEFERVDVFKKRVAPPARPSSIIEQKDWTDEQMEALIEGLTLYPGPYVFHELFRRYCGKGRPLRPFGVPEITAKAAEVRSRLLARYQEQDWQDVPKWISKIPALP